MADRRLTGALFLHEADGTEHVVRFEHGTPVKVRPGDGYALFGEMLVEQGIVSDQVVAEALATKGLLGDVLILTGHAEPVILERVAAAQHERRIVRLFSLPPETSYRYFDGHTALLEGMGPSCRGDVPRLLMAGLRAHPRACMSLGRLMDKLGDRHLRLHPDAVLERFGWTDEEACVATTVLMDRPTFTDLLAAGVADGDVVRRVVYALLITRQLDIGQKATPFGVEDTPPVVAVGRVQLMPAVHRLGAAAPDPAGDGERAAVMPRTLRRRKSDAEQTPTPEDPAECDDEAAVSDVIELAGPPFPARHGDTGTDGLGDGS